VRRPRLSFALGLFAAALLVRLLPWTTVYEGPRTLFMGNDAYYHMRRVVYGLERFPRWLDFDPFLNFPAGARPIWTPVFDWLTTAFVLPFHAAGGVAAAERAAALVPPLLGAACVVMVYFAARRLFDETAARVAGALLSVLAAHAWYSQVGFLDHHAATALLAAGMLWAAVGWMQPGPPSLRGSLLLSVSQAAALLLWPGMLLHLALVETGVVWQTLRERDTGSLRLQQRAWGHLLAFAVVAPLCLGQSWPQWGDYSATVLSRFQPWLFSALAAHAVLCAAAFQARPGSGLALRLGAIAGAAAAVAGLSVLALPGLLDSAADAWRWLGKQETFQSRVMESKGLLDTRPGGSTWLLRRNLSGFGLLLPASLGALLWRSRGRPDRDARRLAALWSAGLMLAALQQRRFGNSAALGVALVSGWALVEAWRAGRSLTPGRARALRVGLVAATALALVPTLSAQRDSWVRTLDRLRGEPRPLGAYHQSRRNLIDAADWLAARAGGDLTGDAPVPPHAVMAPWHLGHRLLYTSRLPTVVGNFGDDLGEENFELHRRYMLSDEPFAAQHLDRARARFVVMESLNAKARDSLAPRTMVRRLNQAPLEGLRHHRLLYLTPIGPAPPGTRFYRIFERVQGAEVTGRAQPGAAVSAALLVRSGNAGLRVRAETTADADGSYRLHLAQASADAARTGGVQGGWEITSGSRKARLEVPAEALAGGRAVPGPDLR